MDYFLTDEQKMVRDMAREIAEKRVLPIRAEMDEKGEYPTEIQKELAKADLCGLWIPEEYGGMGKGTFESALVTEELARVCGGVAANYAVNALATYPILIGGTEEQKKHFLPPIARGEKVSAFALTEPGAGSDAASLSTMAVPDGNDYILNGTKCFITNAEVAEVYTVITMTDKSKGTRGTTAFIVEKGTPGFVIGKEENKMGIRATMTRELHFQDCRVPKGNMLGKIGEGFKIGMRTLDKSRPGIAAQAVGIAQGALEASVEYAKTRQQFNQPIIHFQAIQFMLADMATQIEAARALVYQVCKNIDAGVENYSKESAMAKLFASDVAMKVTTDAVQIFGGYGYMKEYPVEKMMRDAKITQIYEGTNQIQRVVIGASVVREGASR
jgi:alkylation response protein AidB-like acyl-CoA dehydrogenase